MNVGYNSQFVHLNAREKCKTEVQSEINLDYIGKSTNLPGKLFLYSLFKNMLRFPFLSCKFITLNDCRRKKLQIEWPHFKERLISETARDYHKSLNTKSPSCYKTHISTLPMLNGDTSLEKDKIHDSPFPGRSM